LIGESANAFSFADKIMYGHFYLINFFGGRAPLSLFRSNDENGAFHAGK
jgi:hypothetical protein